jgi:hypothetical protein
VLDVRRGMWTSPDTARQLVETYDEYHQDEIRVENNYYQQALLDWLETMDGVYLPLKGHYTGSQKMDPDMGIPLLAAEFERGQWWVPRLNEHLPDCSCGTCIWIREMISFYPGTTEGTDALMASWMSQRAAKQSESYSGGFAIIEL